MGKDLTVLTNREIRNLGIDLEDEDKFEKLDSNDAYISFCLGEGPTRMDARRAARKVARKFLRKGTDLMVVSLDYSMTVGAWTSANYKVDQYKMRLA